MANLSQQRREKMLAFLETLKTQHSDDDSLIAIGEIEKELKAKKYGLVWEEHEEAVDVQMKTQIPVFTEVKKREICADEGGAYNFLLEGDNLHSLYLLEKTHREKIDVIYIDPPYNTGSKDFVYNDEFVVKEDGFRHSKWLSFMSARLSIAKKLLSAKGVIFISIDDNEQAPLKMLCDDIFGIECFVADISWQRTYSPRNDSLGLSSEVEHILVYSKNIEWSPNKLERTDKMDSIYKSPDGDPKPWTSSSLTAPSASSHQGMVYAIQHPFTGELMYPTSGRCWALGQEQMLDNMNMWAKYRYEIINDDEKRSEICGVPVAEIKKGIPAIVLDESIEDAKKRATVVLENGNWPYFYFTNNGKGGIRRKTYLSDTDGRMPTNYWPFAEVGHTDGAKKELKAIFDSKIPFDTPKPTSLIKRVLQIASFKNSTILDFFAGSGTTGHAVLKLNAEDGGNRRFILCTNNENGICENVTYERIFRVINGYSYRGKVEDTIFEKKIQLKDLEEPERMKQIIKKIDEITLENTARYQKLKKQFKDGTISIIGFSQITDIMPGIPANLKYFKTDFVDKESEELADELLEHITEMIELEHGIKVDNQNYVIIMTDEEMDEFEKNVANYTDLKSVFVNQDILLSAKQQKLLDGLTSYVIPNYYFDFELREAGELW